MGDRRHKGPYPKGPKLQGTRTWAEKVEAKLVENEKAGRSPANRAELARVIKRDKSGLGRFLDALLAGGTSSSKMVAEICGALGLDLPLAEAPNDDLEKAVAKLTDLGAREELLAIVLRMLPKR